MQHKYTIPSAPIRHVIREWIAEQQSTEGDECKSRDPRRGVLPRGPR